MKRPPAKTIHRRGPFLGDVSILSQRRMKSSECYFPSSFNAALTFLPVSVISLSIFFSASRDSSAS